MCVLSTKLSVPALALGRLFMNTLDSGAVLLKKCAGLLEGRAVMLVASDGAAVGVAEGDVKSTISTAETSLSESEGGEAARRLAGLR